MKKYFAVSFKYSETVYCSNIAHAETAEAVEAHYSKYEWVSVRECEKYEVEEARRRGKAVVNVADDGTETLYSYGTAIIKRTPAGELVKLWDDWTATTGTHINAFCGLNKAAYMAL